MTRVQMISAIRAIARPMLWDGFCINSTSGAFADAEFCAEHARGLAALHAQETGDDDAWVEELVWGADGHRECAVGGCGRHLDLGGLTSDGILSALGITEEDPLNCSVYPTELALAADALLADDPHWRIWDHHARRVLRRHRRRAHA